MCLPPIATAILIVTGQCCDGIDNPDNKQKNCERAKMRYFSHIKQNSIAETRSTMESFLCYLDKIDANLKKSIKPRGFGT